MCARNFKCPTKVTSSFRASDFTGGLSVMQHGSHNTPVQKPFQKTTLTLPYCIMPPLQTSCTLLKMIKCASERHRNIFSEHSICRNLNINIDRSCFAELYDFLHVLLLNLRIGLMCCGFCHPLSSPGLCCET